MRVAVYKAYQTISTIVWRVLVVLEIILGLRLLLKWLGANGETVMVKLLYGFTDMLVRPFAHIFPNIFWPEGRVLEVDTFFAMVAYIAFTAVILWVVRISFYEH